MCQTIGSAKCNVLTWVQQCWHSWLAFALVHIDYFLSDIHSHQLAPPFSLAVDVGCGTGISTRPLVEYFDHVIGCDVSESMIEKAQEETSSNRIAYKLVMLLQLPICLVLFYRLMHFVLLMDLHRVAPCSQLPVTTGSAQLVLAATAAHWFDPIEDFYREAERVLCPGGTLALCSYSYPEFETSHKYHAELNKAQTKVGDTALQFVFAWHYSRHTETGLCFAKLQG